MGNAVNERVIQLKKESGLSDNNFSSKVGISSGTLNRIKQGEDVSTKTITLICDSLGVNRKWLEYGIGDQMIEGHSISVPPIESVWKDEAYRRLQDEVLYLREMLKLAMQGAKANFQTVSDFAVGNYPVNPVTDVRAAA